MENLKKDFACGPKFNVTPKKGGFTLIELLVVIAIISLLASVVLVSLNSARGKGGDASVKANLAGARSQAELFSVTNNYSYAGVCISAPVLGVKSIVDQVLAAAKAAGYSSVGYNNSPAAGLSAATCNDSANGWAAEVPIKNPAGMWCVDAQGKSKWEAGSIGAAITCT